MDIKEITIPAMDILKNYNNSQQLGTTMPRTSGRKRTPSAKVKASDLYEDNGLSFSRNCTDADVARAKLKDPALIPMFFYSVKDLNKPSAVIDRVAKTFEDFYKYKRNSFKTGMNAILKEDSVQLAVRNFFNRTPSVTPPSIADATTAPELGATTSNQTTDSGATIDLVASDDDDDDSLLKVR